MSAGRDECRWKARVECAGPDLPEAGPLVACLRENAEVEVRATYLVHLGDCELLPTAVFRVRLAVILRRGNWLCHRAEVDFSEPDRALEKYAARAAAALERPEYVDGGDWHGAPSLARLRDLAAEACDLSGYGYEAGPLVRSIFVSALRHAAL